MALLPRQFVNDENQERMGDFSAIPAEDCKTPFISHIVASSLENCGPNAKDPKGQYIKLEFEILQPGKYQKRKIWTNLNIINKNPKAVEIANKELASICDAVGFRGTLTDTQHLHGKPFLLKLKFIPEDIFPEKNVPTGYKPMEGNSASAQNQTEKLEPQNNAAQNDDVATNEQPVESGKRPWETQ